MGSPNYRRALGLLLLDWCSVVLNHSPGSIHARWETLFIKRDTCGGSCWSKIPHHMHQMQEEENILECLRVVFSPEPRWALSISIRFTSNQLNANALLIPHSTSDYLIFSVSSSDVDSGST